MTINTIHEIKLCLQYILSNTVPSPQIFFFFYNLKNTLAFYFDFIYIKKD